jgi:hypothetical protein
MKRWLITIAFYILVLTKQGSSQPELELALARISASSLVDSVSFLASDALEGRMTPSRGEGVAAEFVASRFRKAGLEPVTLDGSYFQEARYFKITPELQDLDLTLVSGGVTIRGGPTNAYVRSLSAVDVRSAEVVELPGNGEPPEVAGRVVAGALKIYGTESGLIGLQGLKPSLILLLSSQFSKGPPSYLAEADSESAPVIQLCDEDAFRALKTGKPLRLSVHASAPIKQGVVLRNVGAVLRGSAPLLSSEYVLISAHYDHLGMTTGSGDRIFNGANDNASGVASVLDIAAALAMLPVHPKRSILFMAFFGEEQRSLGAHYYCRHPLVPVTKTIAAVNLEQMGRTDDSAGPRVGTMSFTGTLYSDLPDRVAEGARSRGVSMYTRRDSADYFSRSDNYALALVGIIAHTLVVAYDYPDYHTVSDESSKLNYSNMAAVVRGVATGVFRLADDHTVPRWKNISETAIYRQAASVAAVPPK